MGDDHQLDLFDPVAERLDLALQLVQRLAGVGARVHQREGLILEQVGVDSTHLEWGGYPHHADPGAGYRLPGGVVAHDRTSPSTSSRFASMSSRETSDSRLRRRR